MHLLGVFSERSQHKKISANTERERERTRNSDETGERQKIKFQTSSMGASPPGSCGIFISMKTRRKQRNSGNMEQKKKRKLFF